MPLNKPLQLRTTAVQGVWVLLGEKGTVRFRRVR
jgi:hypothetical protein